MQPKTTQWLVEIYRYRYRFGIETHYRQLGDACIKSTPRNPTLRLLLVGMARLLRNVWVWVHWGYLAIPRRGGRQLNLHRLRFNTLLMGLTHLAEATFGINDTVIADAGLGHRVNLELLRVDSPDLPASSLLQDKYIPLNISLEFLNAREVLEASLIGRL